MNTLVLTPPATTVFAAAVTVLIVSYPAISLSDLYVSFLKLTSMAPISFPTQLPAVAQNAGYIAFAGLFALLGVPIVVGYLVRRHYDLKEKIHCALEGGGEELLLYKAAGGNDTNEGDIENVIALVNAGAEVGRKNKHEYTALDVACYNARADPDQPLDVVLFLLEKGARTDLRRHQGVPGSNQTVYRLLKFSLKALNFERSGIRRQILTLLN